MLQKPNTCGICGLPIGSQTFILSDGNKVCLSCQLKDLTAAISDPNNWEESIVTDHRNDTWPDEYRIDPFSGRPYWIDDRDL